MLYDQAEEIMAKLATAYPQREVVMALKPRETAGDPRDYAVQGGLDGGVLDPTEASSYEAIAAAVDVVEGQPPISVQFTSAGPRLVAVFA